MDERINKYLSAAGACSRRAADQHILDGEVTINGRVAVLGDQVEETDEVCFQGEHLCLDEPFVLLALRLLIEQLALRPQ